MTAKPPEPPVEEPKLSVSQLIDFARSGRKDFLRALGRALDRYPELWQQEGNIARKAQATWRQLIAGEDLYFQECLQRRAADLRVKLAGPDANPLEELHVERIVALELQVGYYECQIGRYEMATSEKTLEYLHKRRAAADRQFQEAIMNLARIRKLLPQSLKIELVVSGELQTTVKRAEDDAAENAGCDVPKRIRVPQNRIKDVLDAARSN